MEESGCDFLTETHIACIILNFAGIQEPPSQATYGVRIFACWLWQHLAAWKRYSPQSNETLHVFFEPQLLGSVASLVSLGRADVAASQVTRIGLFYLFLCLLFSRFPFAHTIPGKTRPVGVVDFHSMTKKCLHAEGPYLVQIVNITHYGDVKSSSHCLHPWLARIWLSKFQ